MLARATLAATVVLFGPLPLALAQGPAARPDALTVVVESAHPTLTPDAIRDALGRALAARALPLGASDARPRAFVSVVVRADASASFAVRTSSSGVEGASAVTAPSEEQSPIEHLVGELATLVRTVEGRLVSPASVRAGLIPWEPGDLRPYPDPRLGTVSQETLLPWPARAVGSATERPELLGAPAPGREPSSGDDF